MSELTHKSLFWFDKSPIGKVILLSAIILILQIPVATIENLVTERQSTKNLAIQEVQQKWGNFQIIKGPLLIVPYHIEQYIDVTAREKRREKILKYASFFPNKMTISADLHNEIRYRGLYEVPLYQASVHIEGNFMPPDFTQWNVKPEDILWDKAKLVVLVSDARAIQKQAILTWGGETLPLEPGSSEASAANEGYHVNLTPESLIHSLLSYSVDMQLNGSESIYFAPVGTESEINLSANWPNPSFQGKWLPTGRDISTDSFNAVWQIPYLGRNFPKSAQEYQIVENEVNNSIVGANFITPVDAYRMADRSIKYELLFLFLTFLLMWLFEIIAKIPIHLMRYLFIGAALCLFYLLELSLSEHLGFLPAYCIATVAIVVMVSTYSLAILKTRKRVAIIASSLTLLYSYLYTLLQEQNYSLLIGSLGLFVFLAMTMYLTRNTDWHKLTTLSQPA